MADTAVIDGQLAFFFDSLVNADTICVTATDGDTIWGKCTVPHDSMFLDIPVAMQHGVLLKISIAAFTHQLQTINRETYTLVRAHEVKKNVVLK